MASAFPNPQFFIRFKSSRLPMASSCRGSILMCPFMAVGHTMPMLELANHLAEMDFSISFMFPGKNLLARAVNPDNRNPKITYEVVDFGELEEEGGTGYIVSPGLRQVNMTEIDFKEFAKVVYPKFMAIRSRIQELVESTRPLCVIIDPMLFSGGMIVNDLTTVPLYAFIPFSATSVAAFGYVMRNGFTPPAISIPEIEFKLLEHDIPPPAAPDHPQSDLYTKRSGFIQSLCKGVLLNTWEGIEHGSIAALRESGPCRFTPPLSDSVFSIGPMISTSNSFFKSDNEQYTRCKDWLDDRDPSSVLLLCFGSWLVLSDEQMLELAMGIEESGVSFIWVLKSGDRFEWLEGFVERTKNRGLVFLGWAPQQYILSHRAIGGFVMTSGWNSVMEALVLNPRGLVLVAWPIYQDHLPTCRMLVDGLRFCVEVRGSVDKVFGVVKRGDVASAAKLAICGPEAEEMRNRAAELGKLAKESIMSGGSSFKQLEAFAREILQQKDD